MPDKGEARPYLVLGLDIGIGSCGWCVLDIANKHVVDMGAHLWEVPQEPKSKTSTAVTRRDSRSARRNHDRHTNRMEACFQLLKEHDLLPEDATRSSLQTTKGDLQPLEARVKALDYLLTDREFAQVLYNLCNRRGYIPHGEASDSDGRKVLEAIKENDELMKDRGYRTVGEMQLNEGRANGKFYGASRNKGDYSHCVKMTQLLEEVDTIFDAQRDLENPNATQALQEDFKSCMAWQTPRLAT